MRRFALPIVLAAIGLAIPAGAPAQEAAEGETQPDLVAPTPPPRPAEYGGAEAGEEDPQLDPSIVIDGTELENDVEIGPEISTITDPQPVTLSARISDDGPFIPDGLVWRVFDSRTDESGELAMLAKSEAATAAFSLPPGEYMLHVAYGRAQASDTIFVEPGPNNRTVIFEVGALVLNAMVTGDVAIPAEQLMFDIYSDGPSGRVTVAENVGPGEMIHLNAGIYSIVSRYGPVNAVIRSELRVEAGQITEATLYHKAAPVTLKLVSEEGGEAIADVEWTIKTLGGETVFTDIGAFPSTVLAEGDYLVLAKLGDTVYNREFEVTPGGTREVEILTEVY